MDRDKVLYFDHCGTTPLSDAVKAKFHQMIDANHFGNPTAVHHTRGLEAAEEVEESRKLIAQAIGAKPQNIVFTSGASEANNLVLWGFWQRFKDRGVRILYGATEHKSVLEPAMHIGGLPHCESVEVPVDKLGMIRLDVLETLLKDNPKRLQTLVVVMQSNNEIPVRYPIEEISALCIKSKAYFHCDTVQAYVREKVDISKGRYGSVVISSHKFYGPKGLGILAFSDSYLKAPLLPTYTGGEQEFGLRPGTLNTLAINAAAVAVKEHEKNRVTLVEHLKACDQIFVEEMTQKCPGFHLTVPINARVPGIVNFYIERHDAPSLLEKLTKVCMNRGASCTGAGGEKYSHVPKALGLPIEIQANVLRASFGWTSSLDDIKLGVKEIAKATGITNRGDGCP